MIIALLVGRGGSVGMPNKNVYPVLKRPLMSYPLLAALNSKFINEVYVSTDSKEIMNVAIKHGAKVINRPPELAANEAILEDTLVHGYKHVKEETKKDIEFVVVLMCNAVMILPKTIDQGIEILRKRKEIDSTVTVSDYNMWSPIRARKLNKDGTLKPFVPFETFGNPKTLNCDRDSQGDVHFADMSVSIVRPRCLENLKDGLLPQKWMGKKIAPIPSSGGCDVDYEWQFPMVEFWLKKNGF